jgi:hypothetical protein
MNIYLLSEIFLKGMSGRKPLRAKTGVLIGLASISEGHEADYYKESKCNYLGIQIVTS